MDIFITVLVTFVAGAGAGLGTGFAGMSAAVVITPMLMTFLGVNHYMAVGIALAADVLASALSAALYWKHKNIDIKNALIMMITALAFTVLGTFLGSLFTLEMRHGEFIMTLVSLIMTLAMGVKFLVRPVTVTKESMLAASKKKRVIGSVLCGAPLGLICGFAGAGGGILMLIILTSVLGYELKTAIGTSVFVMMFIALFGSTAHFLIEGPPDWLVFALCLGFTFLWAGAAALIANKVSAKTLNITLGIILIILGLVMTVFNVVYMCA